MSSFRVLVTLLAPMVAGIVQAVRPTGGIEAAGKRYRTRSAQVYQCAAATNERHQSR